MTPKINIKKLIPPRLAETGLGRRVSERFAANPRLVVPVVLLLALAIIAGGTLLLQGMLGNGNGFTVSGTIEATEIHLGAEVGGRVDSVSVVEGEKVTNGQTMVTVRGDRVRASIDGVVLERVVEPGEVVAPGATLITLADLESLTLTVYVPEDRYGQILLGEICQVKVDSFPNRSFSGIVTHIAGQAEFTPRNVQTAASRKNTVFAIKLALAPSEGLLKPGMPADVHFVGRQ